VIDGPKLYRIIVEGGLHDFPQKIANDRMKIAERLLL
jgi:hypothetical protein